MMIKNIVFCSSCAYKWPKGLITKFWVGKTDYKQTSALGFHTLDVLLKTSFTNLTVKLGFLASKYDLVKQQTTLVLNVWVQSPQPSRLPASSE